MRREQMMIAPGMQVLKPHKSAQKLRIVCNGPQPCRSFRLAQQPGDP
jgi:hypothetical protein